MKLLIYLLLLSFTFNSLAQDTTSIKESKLIYSSYTDIKETYGISFYSEGIILYQSKEYDYIKDKKICNTFSSIEEIKNLHGDMMKVLKIKKTIAAENYTIKKGAFASVELNIKGIERTYYFTKYTLKLFGKGLKNL